MDNEVLQESTPMPSAESSVDDRFNRRSDGTFGPGNNANPKGGPRKGYSVTEMIKQMMDEKPEIRRALAAKLLEIALKGDLPAIREAMDRLEGKPMQNIKHEGATPLMILDGTDKLNAGTDEPATQATDGSQSTSQS